MRNADAVIEMFRLRVGDAEDFCGGPALGVEMALHRRDFRRLMPIRVVAVHVADHRLCRPNDCCHPHRHREHDARPRIVGIAQQMIGADRADDERGGQIRRRHGMREAERE